MRTMVFLVTDILRLEVIHPSSATLTVTRMEIAVINGKELTFAVKHIVCRYFGVIYLDVFVLDKLDAIEAICESEYTLLESLEFEVRTQHIVGDAVLGVLQFLAVIRPIPGLQFAFEAQRLSIFLQLLHFRLCSRHIRVTQLVKEIHHGLFGLGTGLVQGLHSIVGFVEQLRQLQTGVRNIDDILRIIELSADATGIISHIQFLTKCAVVAVLHHGNIGSRLEIKQPAFFAFLCGIGFEHTFRIVVQTC